MGDGSLQHVLGAVLLLGGLGGSLGGQAGDGEDGALGRLHDGLVGGGHALVEGGSQGHAVGGVVVLQGLGHAAEEQGEDDAGVATGAPQQGGGVGGGSLGHGGGGLFLGLSGGGANGQGHVGAGVAVGHREDVELVDALFLGVDGGSSVHHHALKQCAVNDVDHNVSKFLSISAGLSR